MSSSSVSSAFSQTFHGVIAGTDVAYAGGTWYLHTTTIGSRQYELEVKNC